MKSIVAIIREESVEKTKSALETLGLKGITFIHVTGKGEQRGTVRAPDPLGTLRRSAGAKLLTKPGRVPESKDSEEEWPAVGKIGLGFLPKRMLIIIAMDSDVPPIVQTLIDANQTGRHGDGKIFVCPLISAIRVRTGEQGDDALI
jgi:nitrogen regulatory protein PII 2